MKILLVEDDCMLGHTLQRSLLQSGYTIDWLRDGAAADVCLRSQTYDMVLLDLGLPNQDGLSILHQLRDRRDNVTVIILTARDDVSDRVAGLDGGADDYLIKPISLDELEARIRALQRRQTGSKRLEFTCGDLTLNSATREVRFRGEPLVVTVREYQLLFALIQRPGAILSRGQLEEQMYGWTLEIDSNAVEVHIHRLRQKLGPELIRTVRGLGYQMIQP